MEEIDILIKHLKMSSNRELWRIAIYAEAEIRQARQDHEDMIEEAEDAAAQARCDQS